MMWPDFVFLAGNSLLVMFLYPVLWDTAACVYSALGAFAACTVWSLIATFRTPEDASPCETVADRLDEQFDDDRDLDVAPNGN